MATVTTRACAVFAARIPLPRSICDVNHPPKMSPFGLLSLGMAIVWMTSSPLGSSAIWGKIAQLAAAQSCSFSPLLPLLRLSVGEDTEEVEEEELQNQHAIAIAVE